MKLQGKIAIVTGASSGMGREIASLYAREGAKVLAVARRADRLESLVAETKDFSGQIVAHTADMYDSAQVQGMVDAAIAHFGKLDILVNNAGIMDNMAGVADFDDALLEQVMALNVKAPLIATRQAIRHFLATGGGNIINMASVAGLSGHMAGVIYTASKHAVLGITKNTAYTYAHQNIRCNAICPGSISTEIASAAHIKNIHSQSAERYALSYPMNPRTGTSAEVARIALFLASDDASFVNGAHIVADGGWTA